MTSSSHLNPNTDLQACSSGPPGFVELASTARSPHVGPPRPSPSLSSPHICSHCRQGPTRTSLGSWALGSVTGTLKSDLAHAVQGQCPLTAAERAQWRDTHRPLLYGHGVDITGRGSARLSHPSTGSDHHHTRSPSRVTWEVDVRALYLRRLRCL